LLAVAKLSKPIRKDRGTETVIRVKIRNWFLYGKNTTYLFN
jgi:hypothetical protein